MESDYAWCAGFFDGEGSTSVLKAQRDKYAYIRLGISQKDVRVLEKFQRIMSCGRIYKSKTRNIHSIDIYRSDDVMNVLDKMWPFLSELKKDQASVAIEYVKQHSKVLTMKENS